MNEEEEYEDESVNRVIIDADSIIYGIAVSKKTPNQCNSMLDRAIEEIISTCQAKEAFVVIKGSNNFRHRADPLYKSKRKTDPDIKKRVAKMNEYAADFAVISDGGEADDYCRVIAGDVTGTTIIAHIDKDLDCIPGDHYNYHKDKRFFYQVKREDAYRWEIQQIITGDGTDTINGIWRVGPVKAKAMMEGVSNGQLLDMVLQLYREKGSDPEHFTRAANCIYLREKREDIRVLTYEELIERLTWKTTPATGSHSPTDQTEPSGSST